MQICLPVRLSVDKTTMNVLKYDWVCVDTSVCFLQKISDYDIVGVIRMAKTAIKLCFILMLVSAVSVYAQGTGDFPMSVIGVGVAGLFMMLVIIATFVAYIKKSKIQQKRSRFIDDETGIVNRVAFINRFNSDISSFSRAGYYVAYMVVDSNFLQIYHSAKFEDVVKFLAKRLSENAQSYEIAARVTESGFAFAFRSESDEEAEKRLRGIMEECIAFAGVKKTRQGVFSTAVYHLRENDANCESILFNLRRNCISILGEERDLLFCNEYNMSDVLEEKKLNERMLQGVEKEEFKVFVQFVVDHKKKKLVAAEALARWDTPEKGILSPAKFIGAMTRRYNSGF